MRRAILLLLLTLAFLIPAFLASAFVSSTARAAADNGVQSLRDLLIERLMLMEAVAAHKWNAQRSIDDPARGANVLRATMARARAAGLEPSVARRFIVAQMEAAKMVQRHYFAIWREEGVVTVPNAPDLVTVLRPKIGALSVALISEVAEDRNQLDSCSTAAVLRPVPPELASVPEAWSVAVKGIVETGAACP